MNYRNLIVYLSAILFALFLLFVPELFFAKQGPSQSQALRVMTYSSFLQQWGAGPEIAEKFKEETGIEIDWINAGNAGLLLERLKFKSQIDQPDVVIGLDQFSIFEAKRSFEWLDVKSPSRNGNALPVGATHLGFLAYDWGPMTFIYKNNENVVPPKNLEDLTSERFRGKLILQDPRLSSPGLQFLLWIVNEMGEDKAFAFLKRLKPSIQVMSPSWSSSYSLFKMDSSALVFSYFTSPFYHVIEEDDDSFTAAKLEDRHPVQIEYLGIPKSCRHCEDAQKFATFLRRTDIQRILMSKNYMYPVSRAAIQGSPFTLPDGVRYFDPMANLSLIKKKKELVARWKKIFY